LELAYWLDTQRVDTNTQFFSLAEDPDEQRDLAADNLNPHRNSRI